MATPIEALKGVANAGNPLPHLFTSGQPSAAHLQALKAAGVAVVLDIRDPMEPRPFDEPAVVREAGMEYLNIPVTAGNLDDATLESVVTAVRANTHRPMLFHCASANRVGGALIPIFMLDHGMSEEDAVQAAMRVGMRGADLMQWGLDYVARHRPG